MPPETGQFATPPREVAAVTVHVAPVLAKTSGSDTEATVWWIRRTRSENQGSGAVSLGIYASSWT